MKVIVPPGGNAGFAQMTPASQRALRRGLGYTGRVSRGPKRRRGTALKKRKTARVMRKAKRAASRLVKGSAAAKRYMAKIRRMRKR